MYIMSVQIVVVVLGFWGYAVCVSKHRGMEMQLTITGHVAEFMIAKNISQNELCTFLMALAKAKPVDKNKMFYDEVCEKLQDTEHKFVEILRVLQNGGGY